MSESRHLVDPELIELLESFPPLELSDEVLPALRAMEFPIPEPPGPPPAVDVSVRRFPGVAGSPEVEAQVYRPRAASGPLGAILHVHGGGYIFGKAANQAPMHKALSQSLGCVIVSVDYRLSPETRAPGAVEDAYAGLAWTMAQAGELGVDAARVGVMGESAGGGLAAALALLARDRGEHALAFQHLIYPMLDDRTCTLADPHPFVGEFIWTRAANLFGWKSLLGAAPGDVPSSPYAAARGRTERLEGLPPAFISTGALDLFLEEDLEYARRLTRAGVPVELHVYPGAYHAFDMAPAARVAGQARRDSHEALARALAGGAGLGL